MLAVSYLACSGNILWIWDSSTIYVNTMYAYNICAYILMIWNVREEKGERGERDSRHSTMTMAITSTGIYSTHIFSTGKCLLPVYILFSLTYPLDLDSVLIF